MADRKKHTRAHEPPQLEVERLGGDCQAALYPGLVAALAEDEALDRRQERQLPFAVVGGGIIMGLVVSRGC